MRGPETPTWSTEENPAYFVPDRPVGSQKVYADSRVERETLMQEGMKTEQPMHAVISIFRLVELAHEQMIQVPKKGIFRKRRLPNSVADSVRPYADAAIQIRDALKLPMPKSAKGYSKEEIRSNEALFSRITSDDNFPLSASEQSITDKLSVSDGQDARNIARDSWRVLALSLVQDNFDSRIERFLTHDKDGALLTYDEGKDEMRKIMVVSHRIAHNTVQMSRDIVAQLDGQYPDIAKTYKGIIETLSKLCRFIEKSDGTLLPKISEHTPLYISNI